MRWWVFIPVLALVLTMDAAFMPAFAIGGHVPQLWPLLLAFVALYASRGAALWAAMIVGIWLDAMHPALGAGAETPRAVTVFGPHVLACAAGAWCVLETRTWLYRRNVLTVAFSTFNCALLASLAFIAIAGIRAAAVGSDMVDALYSAVIAILPAWGLQSTLTVWGFATAGPRFAGGNRMYRGND